MKDAFGVERPEGVFFWNGLLDFRLLTVFPDLGNPVSTRLGEYLMKVVKIVTSCEKVVTEVEETAARNYLSGCFMGKIGKWHIYC